MPVRNRMRVKLRQIKEQLKATRHDGALRQRETINPTRVWEEKPRLGNSGRYPPARLQSPDAGLKVGDHLQHLGEDVDLDHLITSPG
jgi:hypothetical protein